MKRNLKDSILSVILIFTAATCTAQKQFLTDTSSAFTESSAGPEYKASSFHKMLWGKNYRDEWNAKVKVPVMLLDTAKGGLIPYKKGRGHQTSSLHLRDVRGKEYVIRSIDKSASKILPEAYQNTFIQNIAKDETSMSHPYGALALPYMEQRVGLYHTNPAYVFVPHQPSLDTFNKIIGDKLYLFEQKIKGNWEEANNLGNFKKFKSTKKVVKKMLEDNDCLADQKTFLKARLFDMFIGDFDRHEGQWKWGESDTKNSTLYVPIPQDRDQAFFKHDGVLSKIIILVSGAKYLQSFGNNIDNVKMFNYPERNLDRFFTNRLTFEDWKNSAKELQLLLTDEVIKKSVQELPPEIFSISGKEIISKLEERRKHLVEWATEYYLFLAKEVQIAGSEQKEYFAIKQFGKDSTTVKIYRLDKKGKKKDNDPYYSRTFNSRETKTIRIFGVKGKDKYVVGGTQDNKIKLQIVGGPDRDSIVENAKSKKISVYDDENNFFQTDKSAKLHLSDDTSIHSFNYDWFNYDKRSLKPSIFFSYEDRLYLGLGYGITHYKWRKQPYVYKQSLDLHYSLMQKAFSLGYSALFPGMIGRRGDLSLSANYDAIRWTNFFGLGNETKFKKDINYYRMRTEEWLFSPTVIYKFGKSKLDLSPFYQSTRIINDDDRFVSKAYGSSVDDLFSTHSYAGAQARYTFTKLNNALLPTSGFVFSVAGLASQNLKQDKAFEKVSGNFQFVLPLMSKLSFSVAVGGGTVTGKPEFYQYLSIGGPNLRGYIRDRYWGKSVVYNMNDLRFITNVKTHFYSGKAGVLLFVDNGRVWMPGEISNTLHTGYGAGLLLAPFNKVSGEITYGFSPGVSILQVRIYKYF